MLRRWSVCNEVHEAAAYVSAQGPYLGALVGMFRSDIAASGMCPLRDQGGPRCLIT